MESLGSSDITFTYNIPAMWFLSASAVSKISFVSISNLGTLGNASSYLKDHQRPALYLIELESFYHLIILT